MLKHKITGIIMGTLVLSGALVGVNTINNVNRVNENTKVVNKVLLANPSSTEGERAVVVNTDNSPLVLYSSANSNSTITSYISVGEMLTILNSGDNFYNVKVQETGAIGYISAHNLQIITSGVSDSYKAINKQGYIINVSSRVNLRSNATMSSNILAKLSNNTKINVLGKQGEWYKVNCNGTVGYIYQEYVGIDISKSNNVKTNKITNKTNSSDIKQINKAVKIYIPYKECIYMTKTPMAEYFSYKIPSGINTVYIINQNSYDGLTYIKFDGKYGYVNTKQLDVLENDYKYRSVFTNNSTNSSKIKWLLSKGESTTPTSLVIENTTGKPILNNQLAEYIKNWILNYEVNYSMSIASSLWAPEFFNAVPDEDLVQAFINANGKGALSKNITAGELDKTNLALMELIEKNHPLLSNEQLNDYFHKIISGKIVKVVKEPVDYIIYASNGEQIYHSYVDVYTGYAN